MIQEDSNDDIINHMINNINQQNIEKSEKLPISVSDYNSVDDNPPKVVETLKESSPEMTTDNTLETKPYSTFIQDIRYNLILIDYNKQGCTNSPAKYEKIVNYIINGLPDDNEQENQDTQATE
jgi:hypothetical protein